MKRPTETYELKLVGIVPGSLLGVWINPIVVDLRDARAEYKDVNDSSSFTCEHPGKGKAIVRARLPGWHPWSTEIVLYPRNIVAEVDQIPKETKL